MSLWNEANIELLTTYWKEGLSASQVAEKLGPEFTKNAVIGKIHRLKIQNEGNRTPRPRAASPKPRTASRGVSRPRRAVARSTARSYDHVFASRLHHDPIPEIDFLLPDTDKFGSSIAVMALGAKSCKWPVGDPLAADFRFCGAHAPDVYCEHHQSVAYRGVAARPERIEERQYA